MSYELASTVPFWQSLEALSPKHRRAVLQTLGKVHDGHASIHVHKLEGLPFVSFGVTQDALRVVCKRDGDTLLLCHVGPHDDAYRWARRHKVLQVGRFVRILRAHEQTPTDEGAASLDATSASLELASSTAETSPPLARELTGPLAAIVDDVFRAFDVGPLAAAVLRGVPDEDCLLDVLEHFPLARSEALMGLATDPDDLDALQTAYLLALDAEKSGAAPLPPSFADALRDEVNAGTIWKPDPDDDAYRRALEGDFDAWRVFLHPSQRRLVRVEAKGALRITGGPGTGKTVVALHRARHLAERTPDARVVLTTFNATLARQLERSIDVLVGPGPSRDRIVVRSLTQLARDVLAAAKRPHAFVAFDDELWDEVRDLDILAFGRAFYEEEREQVLAVHDAWTEADYFAAPRRGRGKTLDRKQKRDVWRVLDAIESALARRGGGDLLALSREATRALRDDASLSPYRAIVCDEAQDLGPTELRFLAALARDPSAPADAPRLRRDGLTLCGDGHQRLYRLPVSLESCGIRVRGRASRKLRLNYRTTEAIRRAAMDLLDGVPLDAFDAPADDLGPAATASTSHPSAGHPSVGQATTQALDGYRSLRPGQPVERLVFPDLEAEADHLAALARTNGAPKPLLLLVTSNAEAQALVERLEARALHPKRLDPTDLPTDEDTLLVSTFHRSKGLEAPWVVLVRPNTTEKSRRAVFVGMTRARDRVWVVGGAT